MKRMHFVSVLMGLIIMAASPAFAHYLSVYVDNYHPEPGDTVTISMCYGHSFPEKVYPQMEKIKRVYLIDPDGSEIPLSIITQGKDNLVLPIKHQFDKPGSYLFVAERNSYFLCKTTEGYKYKAKKELENVLSSSWSEANAMAIINVGKTAGNAFNKPINQRFQILAVNDPGKLVKGDQFKASVLLDGIPSHADLYAIVAGASDQNKNMATPAETKDGAAGIDNLKPGAWLVKASEKRPFPNKEDADQYSFTSTLTFGVK